MACVSEKSLREALQNAKVNIVTWPWNAKLSAAILKHKRVNPKTQNSDLAGAPRIHHAVAIRLEGTEANDDLPACHVLDNSHM